jgi:uncharacterized protein YbjT (DUF2867 family)
MTRVLVTGVTGYVGGRLVPELLSAGIGVRAFARTPSRLTDVPWRDDVEVVPGDLLDAGACDRACADVDVVYYLVHSMSARGDFESTELLAARNLAYAAAANGVTRIVYLSGLHPDAPELSRHLHSRVAVGRVFLDCPVPAVVLQAGIVIGSGSASFEMIRHLTDILPYMPAPRWVRNRVQPIAIRDVLRYLVAWAQLPGDVNRTFDIGGPDVLRYGQMMNAYAIEAGLPQRPIAPLPVLTPWLASQWVNLVTPIPRDLAVPIIESLQHDCVVREHDIDDIVPPPPEGLLGYRAAVRLALRREAEGAVRTSWRDASVAGASSDPIPSDPEWAGHTVYVDERTIGSTATTGQVWERIESIGGENGWYSFPLAWAARGWMDRLVGGVGLRRGRRDARRLQTGDALDFWRVESLERGAHLRLRAEMRVPGRAWLELEVAPTASGSRYRQRAVFFPHGLAGRLYWWSMKPFHGVIFSGMASRMAAPEPLGEHRQSTVEQPA